LFWSFISYFLLAPVDVLSKFICIDLPRKSLFFSILISSPIVKTRISFGFLILSIVLK